MAYQSSSFLTHPHQIASYAPYYAHPPHLVSPSSSSQLTLSFLARTAATSRTLLLRPVSGTDILLLLLSNHTSTNFTQPYEDSVLRLWPRTRERDILPVSPIPPFLRSPCALACQVSATCRRKERQATNIFFHSRILQRVSRRYETLKRVEH